MKRHFPNLDNKLKDIKILIKLMYKKSKNEVIKDEPLESNKAQILLIIDNILDPRVQRSEEISRDISNLKEDLLLFKGVDILLKTKGIFETEFYDNLIENLKAYLNKLI